MTRTIEPERQRGQKPRLRGLGQPICGGLDYALWRVIGHGTVAYGHTPEMAYRNWLERIGWERPPLWAWIEEQASVKPQPWQQRVLDRIRHGWRKW